jgi:hypothetical protein
VPPTSNTRLAGGVAILILVSTILACGYIHQPQHANRSYRKESEEAPLGGPRPTPPYSLKC